MLEWRADCVLLLLLLLLLVTQERIMGHELLTDAPVALHTLRRDALHMRSWLVSSSKDLAGPWWRLERNDFALIIVE